MTMYIVRVNGQQFTPLFIAVSANAVIGLLSRAERRAGYSIASTTWEPQQ